MYQRMMRTPLQRLLAFQMMSGGNKAIEEIATGNPCVFTTNLAKPLRRLALSLLPRQSGTGDPSPSNIRPLLPWGEVGTWTGGKNLLDVHALATAPYGSFDGFGFKHKLDLHLTPNTYYTLSSSSTGAMNVLYFNGTNSGQVGVNKSNPRTQYSGSTGILSILLYDRENIADYENELIDLQLEVGQTATAYEPYTPITPHLVNLQKNLLDPSSLVPGFYTNNGTINNPDTTRLEVSTEEYISLDGVSQISIGYEGYQQGEEPWRCICWYDSSKGFISRSTKTSGNAIYKFDVPQGASFARFSMRTYGHGYGGCYVAFGNDLAYQPYLPPVYGCELDLTTGEVWGTHGIYTFTGNENFDRATHSSVDFYFFRWAYDWQGFDFNWNVGEQNASAEKYPVENNVAYWYTGGRSGDKRAWTVSSYQGICFRDDDYENVTDFAQSLAGMKMAYELATPVLLATLTPQQVNALVGVNTVWSDADGVEVTYLKKG